MKKMNVSKQHKFNTFITCLIYYGGLLRSNEEQSVHMSCAKLSRFFIYSNYLSVFQKLDRISQRSD